MSEERDDRKLSEVVGDLFKDAKSADMVKDAVKELSKVSEREMEERLNHMSRAELVELKANVEALLDKQGRPAWDHYFIDLAYRAASRATCDRKHVGCVITIDNRVVSTGYNGSIAGDKHCDEVGHDMLNGHCVSGGTIISKFQTGRYNSGHHDVRYIHRAWQDPRMRGALKRMKIRAMTRTGLIVPAGITDVWSAGIKEVFVVRTSLGRTTRVTSDHEFYTPDGWVSLRELGVDDQVALNGRAADVDIAWLAERYRAGATLLDLSRVVGRSRGFVRRRLQRAGVAIRDFSFGGWNKGLRRGDTPRYGGRDVNISSAHGRARRYALGDECAVCGCSERLDVHHIDGDVGNDADVNLRTLCRTCHVVAHTPHAKTTTVVFDKVASISRGGFEEVFDLTVGEHHNFVGDGFVLHNCVRTAHAEANAVADAARRGVPLDGSTAYCTALPCWICFRLLVQAGVDRIVYAEQYRVTNEMSIRTMRAAERLCIDITRVERYF